MIMAKTVNTLYIRDEAIDLLVAEGKRIKKWASLRLEPGLVSQGLVQDEARVADAITKLFDLAKTKKTKLIVGVSGLNSIYRLLSLPRLPKAILPEAARHEARRVIPAPLEEVYLSYQLLPAPHGETRLFLAAFPRNVTDALVRTLHRARVQPYLMDLAPLALCRISDQPRAILVHARSDHLEVMIMENRLPQLIRRLSLPGEVVPLDERLPAIVEEVDRTITFYNSGHKEKPLDSTVPMFVSGDLVQAPQSWPALAGKLNCPVSILPSPMEPMAGFDANEFMVNIGLALKVLLPPKGASFSSLVNFNALPQVYLPKPVRLSNVLVPVGVVVVAFLLVYIGVLAHQKANDNSLLRSELLSAQSRVTEQQTNVATVQQQLKQVEDSIAPVQATADTLDTTLTSLEAGRQQLDGELADIIDLLPGTINLTAVNCQSGSVTVTGTALDVDDFSTYIAALRTRFSNVAISSIAARQEGGVVTGLDFTLLLTQ
jgi:type IV pilus assembly protein PilM